LPHDGDVRVAPSPASGVLAPFRGERPPAPAWFDEALSHAPERSSVAVAGASIETLAWGRRGAPGLLLLHGHGANADWWSFIAPFFADRWRVAAPSWSGMGRSDWREGADFELLADEAFAAAEACGLCEDGPPVVVGHSFGGIPTIYAASTRPQAMRAGVLLDCFFAEAGEARPAARRLSRPPPLPIYPSLAEALARFRLAPPQSCENAFIVDHIARHSLKEVGPGSPGGPGWTWRVDPALRAKIRRVAIAPHLAAAKAPLAMITGARSGLMTPKTCARIAALAPPGTPHIQIPDADHHLMVDQPLALVAALRTLLAVWPG
jgi:pimeloyl-ACP methyl ester carboxylesterase